MSMYTCVVGVCLCQVCVLVGREGEDKPWIIETML